MADFDLTQAEADALLATEKHRVDDHVWYYPNLGEAIRVPLTSADKREAFLLDIRRGRVDFRKVTYQNRTRLVTILARLDLGGAPHENPDGEVVPSPHLHVYKEGYADKWAEPVPKQTFPNINDPWKTLGDFMTFCNVTKQPNIQRDLFT